MPFDWDPPIRRFIVVRVRVNGSDPLPFAVDTGFGVPLVVFPWAADQTKMHPNGQTALTRPGNLLLRQTSAFDMHIMGAQDTKGASLNFSFGCIMDEPEEFTEYPGPRLAGIVGVPLFHSATIRFDFDQKRLFAYQPNTPLPTSSIPGAFTVPLEKRSADEGPELLLKIGFPPNVSVPMAIDTGFQEMSLLKTEGKKVKSLDSTTGLIYTLAGTDRTDRLLIAGLTLGSAEIPLTDVTINPQPGFSSLGMQVLSQFNFIIDSTNGNVIFLPRKDPRSYDIDGSFGFKFVLDRDSDQCTITDIEKDSPAAKAGLQSGDRIKAIDGNTTSRSNPVTIEAALAGNAWKPVTLIIERPIPFGATKRLTFTFSRQSPFPLLRHSAAGFTVLKRPHQPAEVVAVETGSAAATAGLTIGDLIVSVQGVATTPLSPDKLDEALAANSGGKITLAVQRDGKAPIDVAVSLPVVVPASATTPPATSPTP